MDDMTAIGDTDGKVPFDKLILQGVTPVGGLAMIGRRIAAVLVALWLSAPLASAAEKFEAGLLGSPNSAGWIWYIGEAEGFFAKANLEPDIIYVPTPAGLMQQLAAGSLDTVEIGVVEPIHAIARGAPVAILRIMGAVPPYEMVANVKTVKELKGKTIVIGGLLDINRVYLERIMSGNGLHDGDYDITIVGNTPGRFAAMKSGSANATMLAAPFNFFAEAAGFHDVGLMTICQGSALRLDRRVARLCQGS